MGAEVVVTGCVVLGATLVVVGDFDALVIVVVGAGDANPSVNAAVNAALGIDR